MTQPGGRTRRDILRRAAIGGASLATPSIWSRNAAAQPRALNVAAYGGVVNQYLEQVFGAPYEKRTGVHVNFGANASLALAKLQGLSGAPAQWDIIILTGAEYVTALQQDMIEPYDYSIIDASHVPDEYRAAAGIKFSLYLFVMAWDRRQVADDRAPASWAEFWDTGRIKGKRSLYANVSDGSTLEAALLADGVAIDKLYPLDVDRALRSLERLGRGNIIWHTTNQEPIQQLVSGAVPLADCFNGRVILANRAGAELGFTPAYSAVSGNPYCVMRSSANKTEAFRFLNYMFTDAKADAEYMRLTNYAIPNTEALALLPKEVLDILPTSPALKGRVFVKDDAWWAQNLAKVSQQFKEWQLSG